MNLIDKVVFSDPDDEVDSSNSEVVDFEQDARPHPVASSQSPRPSSPHWNHREAFVEDVTGIVEDVLRFQTGYAAASNNRSKSDSKPFTAPKAKGRGLVVCIDGTANQFGLTNTNVVELFSRLVADENQLIYYNSGIATYVAESNIFVRGTQKVKHWLDLAFAWGHEEITLKAYQWLSENYVDGDRIYLFGFSRGAYQVRIISGMLKTVGLLRKGNNEQIRFAYQLYLAMIKVDEREWRENTTNPSSESWLSSFWKLLTTILLTIFIFVWKRSDTTITKEQDPTVELCKQFKKTLSHEDVQVHFVGVWDTVSSIGITRGPSFPETTTGMTHVRAFRHAISLNELRDKFLPEFANGGLGPVSDKGDVKEVWFIGSHSDIGGGNIKNLGLNSFGPSLRWMLYEAIGHGLLVKPYQGGWGAVQHIPSMNRVWWLFELLPLTRLAYDGKDRNAVTRWPHLAAGRRIQDGQRIHESAMKYLRENKDHRTHAQILHAGSWVALEDRLDDLDARIEEDSHSKMAVDTIRILETETDGGHQISKEHSNMVVRLLLHPVGQQSFVDSLVTAENATTALIALRVISEASPQSLSAVASRVMGTFGSSASNGHSSSIFSVAYSRDGKHVASGSADNTIRLWDADTGQPVGNPFRGHTDAVQSVAFSFDGTRTIASASRDGTVRIWDVASHREVGHPLTGHSDVVRSVAFSWDGRLVVSGSDDTTIRIWDTMTGLSVGDPLYGHSDCVRSVSLSPDERLVVSGSDDNTIRIWNIATRELMSVLEGHSGGVNSVAFTPDSKRVVSGSRDNTVRVWDVMSGELVRNPLRGEDTGEVNSVAVSPYGRCIASGSDDQSIWLWDSATEEVVGDPLRGCTGPVLSVAFSPDGRRIVSGTYDSALKFWDLDNNDVSGTI